MDHRIGRLQSAVRPQVWYLVWIAFAAFMGCERNEISSNHPPSTHSPLETLEPTSTSTCSVTLRIGISGFGNDSGSCRVAVYLGAAHFNDPEYAIAKEAIGIHDSKASWQVELQIPVQTDQAAEAITRIAVSAYHDENDNSRLDKNPLGIPLERYGFSRDPKRGFGPPLFNLTAIELKPSVDFNDANRVLEIPILVH